MVRILRYPYMSALSCVAVMICALGRDLCISESLLGWAQVLLILTLALLAFTLALMSCRLFIDEHGIGVGFLLHVRQTNWNNIASLGLLYCNSHRRYLYGMYHGETDFINLIHHAPYCGKWGFVAPASNKLLHAVSLYCPFEIDLSPMPSPKHKGRMHIQGSQTLLYTFTMLPTSILALATGILMFCRAAQTAHTAHITGFTLCALMLIAVGITLLYRLLCTILTCPAYSTDGICAGVGLYVPWTDVHFGYVHRIARMSGLFLLSQPLETVRKRGAPPMLCLSIPDTKSLILAYLMYCPNVTEPMEP